MTARSRIVYRTKTSAVLNANHTPPWYSTLLQFAITYASAPTTAARFTIFKQSINPSGSSIPIYSDDPSIDGKTSDLLLCDIEFAKGDNVQIDYANPNNVQVAIELIFREAV